MWRIDFQLGWDADPEEEKKPERILPRLRAMLGPDARVRDRVGERVHVPVPAHAVVPPRPRDLRRRRRAPRVAVRRARREQRLPGHRQPRLEARAGAGRATPRSACSTATTRSAPTPPTRTSATPRARPISSRPRATLRACSATRYSSLRGSTPSRAAWSTAGACRCPQCSPSSALNTPDADADFAREPGAMIPGAPAADAPVTGASGDWLLDYLHDGFALLAFGNAVPADAVAALARLAIPCRVVQVGGGATPGATLIDDREGLAARRYDARLGTVYLLRPDQHVAARWREFDLAPVRAAHRPRHVQRLTRQRWPSSNTEPNMRRTGRLLRGADRHAQGPDRRAERARQRQARAAPRQSHRRPRRARRRRWPRPPRRGRRRRLTRSP